MFKAFLFFFVDFFFKFKFFPQKILAEAAFMASAIKFREQKYLKGMLDFKKSWNRYRECDQIFAKLCNSDTGISSF